MTSIAMPAAVLFVCLSIVPSEDVARDEVDLVEVNHYYDDHARHVFDQIIFYDWSDAECRFQVRAWRLLKSPSQLPQRNWAGGGYDVIWHDGQLMRRVHARAMRETWTQYDPEMRERSHLPKDQRRRLFTPRAEARYSGAQ